MTRYSMNSCNIYVFLTKTKKTFKKNVLLDILIRKKLESKLCVL